MGLRGTRRGTPRRVAIIGLDGTPYTYLRALLERGDLPNFRRLLGDGTLLPMTSVLPTVSCVAWTSIMTGVNPGKHGIYGFVERQRASYDIYINTSAHVRTKTLWDMAGEAGRRVVVVNVPNTYPPRPIHGLLVGGFETPDLRKGVYPAEAADRLERLGYRIDIDAWAARRSKDLLMEDLHRTFERRTAAFLDLIQEDAWDLFIGVYMETDRLHHFLWEHMEQEHPVYAPAFLDFYRKIDAALGDIAARLDDRAVLMVLSDHGFCTLRRELFVNRWLEEQGWLRFARSPAESLKDIGGEARAYSLDPGRVYLNLRGREPAGRVEPADYVREREALADAMSGLVDPDTNGHPIERVYRREELYRGPWLSLAPDLVLLTREGYEPKGAVNHGQLFSRNEIEGMHTTANAMLYVRGSPLGRTQASVVDVLPTVLDLLDIPIPPNLDGSSLTA